MISTIARDWATAIESDEYPAMSADVTTLRYHDTWTPMGVLCELYRLDNGGEWVDDGFKPISGPGSRYWIPEEVCNWAGIKSKFAVVPGVGAIGLMHARYPVERIAQLIRENAVYL